MDVYDIHVFRFSLRVFVFYNISITCSYKSYQLTHVI